MPIEYRLLIIYDISSNKKRNKLVEILNSYGERVQKSAFEAKLNNRRIKNLLHALEHFSLEDKESIRVYRFTNGDYLYWTSDLVSRETVDSSIV